MSDRNNRCPCGSGQKHKACCGSVSKYQKYVGKEVILKKRVMGFEQGEHMKVDSVCGERFSLSQDGQRVLTAIHSSFLVLPEVTWP